MLEPNRTASENSSELLPVASDEISPELRPSRWVTVTEMPEGGFTGEFRLACAGIIRARWEREREAAENIPARQDRMLRSILAVLKEGDAVEFRFHGGGGEQLQWEIRGQSSRATEELASEGAAALLPSFRALTTAIEEQYRFEPASPAESLAAGRLAFCDVLSTEATALLLPKSGVSLGFAASASAVEPAPDRVVIPVFQPKKGFAFPCLAAVIAGSPVPLSCAVRLTPFALTKAENELVRKALEHVLSSLAYGKHPSGVPADEEQSLNGCREALGLWLTSGAGYRIQAELSSPAPLSAALRSLVTNDLFPHNSASRQAPAGVSSELPQGNLDLSNSIAARGTLPVLFPDLETLQRQDLAQIYNRKCPKLPATGVRLGHIEEGGLQMKVHADPAYRNTHFYICGATGTGKSTLLFNGIEQDIVAGNGLCVIDPHGDLYENVLASVPAARKNDVILLNPCETDAVPGINFLEVTSEKTRAFEVNYAINELVKMLDRLYDLNKVGGPMFEMYFRNALVLLTDSKIPGYTLAELPAIFEDKEFREHLKKNCANQYAINFWTRQAEKAGGDASLANIAPYITSKLNLLIQSALLRPIIGQSRSTINFRQVMDSRQILLVNLSKGQLGELDMQLLGMLIIGKIFSAAMGRATIPEAKRVPFHLYVDEFQNFTTDTVASLLSEARKFGLSLTLANQNLAQLNSNKGNQDLLHAILGNVGSFILFRLGSPDAEKMQLYTRPHFNYEDLQNLPNYHALGRIQTATGPSIPFVFKTEPAAAVAPRKTVLNAIHRRQRHYRSPRELVEKLILDRQNVAVASVPPADVLAELEKVADVRRQAHEKMEKAERTRLLGTLRLRAGKLESDLAAENAKVTPRRPPPRKRKASSSR